jgi:uncharacterized protein YutE (UPF0331/DUF86 family)
LVVSREVSAARLRRLERAVRRLRRLAALPEQEYLADEDAQALAERHFQVAVQCLLDVANHIVAEQGLGSPDDAEGLFLALVPAGVISRPLYERIQGLGGFRNILVHEYLLVDHRIVHRLLGRLDDLVELARELDEYVERTSVDSDDR